MDNLKVEELTTLIVLVKSMGVIQGIMHREVLLHKLERQRQILKGQSHFRVSFCHYAGCP